MKQLTCEMCGGTDLIKQDGVFVCQNCGMKYSVEEAKKMMIEGTVDVQGTVTVDNSAFVQKYLLNARRAKQKEDWEEVKKYYNMVEQNDPTNIEAIFYSTYAQVKLTLLVAETKDKRQSVFNTLIKGVSIIDDNFDDTNEEHKKVLFDILNDIVGLKNGTIVPTTHLQEYVTKNGYGNIVDRNQVVENDSLDVTYNMINQVAKAYIESLDNIKNKANGLSSSPVFYLYKAVCIASTDLGDTKSLEQVLLASKYPVTDDNRKLVNFLINYPCGIYKAPLLCFAAANFNVRATQYLLALGADVNYQSPVSKVTALWYVCRNKLQAGKEEEGRQIAQLLLDKGADVNITNSGGVALYNKNTDPVIANMLLAKHPDLQQGSAPAKSGCYVATAVYGSYDCPQVWTLRRYRDYTLAETWYGRAFIRTYYAISPTLVKWFGHTEWFKKMWQGKLDRMVTKLQANGVESTPYEDKEWR